MNEVALGVTDVAHLHAGPRPHRTPNAPPCPLHHGLRDGKIFDGEERLDGLILPGHGRNPDDNALGNLTGNGVDMSWTSGDWRTRCSGSEWTTRAPNTRS